MKKIFLSQLFCLPLLFAVACSAPSGSATDEKQEGTEQASATEQENPNEIGIAVNEASAMPITELTGALQAADSMEVTVSGKVVEVCQKKGCWMTIERGEEAAPMMVRFKDYALFMPKDLSGKDVVIHGLARNEMTSVADLKHYAEDAGKSQEEIDAITEPTEGIAFLADGVLIK